jgi:hypothetical protein
VQVTGLPALDPIAGLLLIHDPPELSGTSDCFEVCGMDAASGRITTQWTLRDAAGPNLALASPASLREKLQSTSFATLLPLVADQEIVAGRRRLVGPKVVLILDVEQQHVEMHAAGVLRRTVPLAARTLVCDDDPETGERNVRIRAHASDLQAWIHTDSQLLLLRAVYLGNDQACTRAEWLLVRPN